MPPKTSQSSLLAKLGARGQKAHEQFKNDETIFDTAGELPPGIENGVAQIVECKFDTYKKGDMVGEFFFYAAAVVKRPKEVDGVSVEGLRTSIMEPLCDTPKRSRALLDDHYQWILNELRKLGVETRNLKFEHLEITAAAIKQQQPHIRFRTWRGEASKEFPNPRTNNVWNGLIDFNEDDDGTGGVNDNSGVPAVPPAPLPAPVPPKAKASGSGSKPPTSKKTAVVAPEPEPESEPPEPVTGFSEFEDTESLVAAAVEGDTDAQTKLQEMAATAGHLPSVIDAAGSWQEVADMASNPPESGGEEEGWSGPEVGAIHGYCPLNPKTKVRAENPVDCEVMTVNAEAKTCNLKNLTDRKTVYKAVAWNDLAQS